MEQTPQQTADELTNILRVPISGLGHTDCQSCRFDFLCHK